MTLTDEDGLAAAWERADREHAFWEANRADLTQRYPDLFVAVVDEQVLDTDPDLYALAERLQAGGHDLREVWISFMRFKSPPLLL
jgi:hypothetical protein